MRPRARPKANRIRRNIVSSQRQAKRLPIKFGLAEEAIDKIRLVEENTFTNFGLINDEATQDKKLLMNMLHTEIDRLKLLLERIQSMADNNMLTTALNSLHTSLGCSQECQRKPFMDHFSPRTLLIVSKGVQEHVDRLDFAITHQREIRNKGLCRRAQLRQIRQNNIYASVEKIDLAGIQECQFPGFIKGKYYQLMDCMDLALEIYIILLTAIREYFNAKNLEKDEVEAHSQRYVKDYLLHDIKYVDKIIRQMKPQIKPTSMDSHMVTKECELQSLLRLHTLSDSDNSHGHVDNRALSEILWLLLRVSYYDGDNINRHKSFVRDTIMDEFLLQEEEFNVFRRNHLAYLFEELMIEMPPELIAYAEIEKSCH